MSIGTLAAHPHPSLCPTTHCRAVRGARALCQDLSRNRPVCAFFSVMHDGISGPLHAVQGEMLEALHERYNMNEHGRGDAQQASAIR